jgi:hypothetical protein
VNERIRELVRQAGLDDADFPIENWDNVPLEKFALLIVAECIGIVENLSPGYKDYRDQIEDAFRRDCVIEIKKRFGVE